MTAHNFAVGQKVKFKSMTTTFKGTIQTIDNAMVSIMLRNGHLFTVPLKEISAI